MSNEPILKQGVETRPNRRQFLVGAGGVAGGLVAASLAPSTLHAAGPEAAVAVPAPAILRHGVGTQQQVTRYDVTTFTEGSQQLTSLRNGVAAMKARQASDPTSWAYQASIHDTFCDDPPPGYTVVHYSWRFLAWHRAYLYYFEKILRAASGDPNLSLPYWNWTADLTVPAQYWGAGNSLYDSTRVITPTQQLNPARTAISRLMGLSSFTLFGGDSNTAGALETGAHNYVHVSVGGDMGDFSTAALDPIFWAHHANVDRVWYMWNQEGNTNPGTSDWLSISYPFYDIDQGSNVNVSFADAVAVPVAYAVPPAQVIAVSDTPGVTRLSAPETSAPVRLSGGAVSSVLGNGGRASATLRVVGATIPDRPVTVSVFAERPGATAATSTADPGFAGSFSLVPTGPNHAQHEINLHVALGGGFHRALMANEAAVDEGAQVRFTLVPTAEGGTAAPGVVTYDRLELHVQ